MYTESRNIVQKSWAYNWWVLSVSLILGVLGESRFPWKAEMINSMPYWPTDGVPPPLRTALWVVQQWSERLQAYMDTLAQLQAFNELKNVEPSIHS